MAASSSEFPDGAYEEISDGTYGVMKQLGKKPFGKADPWMIKFILDPKLFCPCSSEGYVCKHRGVKNLGWCGCCTEVRVISNRFLLSMVYH